MESMEAFHPLFFSAAKEIFEKKRIDADVRPGKMDGAFCKSFAPFLPPYISMNYTGHLRDLMVLAHEIGHGIHFMLSRYQSYLNYKTPPVLSETAATFCEIMVADHLLGKRDFQAHRKNLLACHIEGIFTTVFRQTVLTRFEQAIHRIRQDHLLSEEEISQCWWEENLSLYGEDVALPELYKWGWACVPHFFHRHFYCYNYIFGNLFAILLFQKCRARKGFIDDVIRLFSRGGSEGPLAMFQELGFDFNEASFWERPFDYVKTLIESLKSDQG
jgi:oligoendopeptidase F